MDQYLIRKELSIFQPNPNIKNGMMSILCYKKITKNIHSQLLIDTIHIHAFDNRFVFFGGADKKLGQTDLERYPHCVFSNYNRRIFSLLGEIPWIRTINLFFKSYSSTLFPPKAKAYESPLFL